MRELNLPNKLYTVYTYCMRKVLMVVIMDVFFYFACVSFLTNSLLGTFLTSKRLKNRNKAGFRFNPVVTTA